MPEAQLALIDAFGPTGSSSAFSCRDDLPGRHLTVYIDPGTVSDTLNAIFPTGAATGAVAATTTSSSDIREHIFRIGLNYKFDRGSVVANY
jgi:hypothetical protein